LADVSRIGYEGEVIYVPLGSEGLSYNANPDRVPPAGLLSANSVVFTEDSVRKEPGRTLITSFNPTTRDAVAVHDWHASEGDQRFACMSSDGDFIQVVSATPGAGGLEYGYVQASGAPALSQGYFVTGGHETPSMNRKLFCFTGKTPVGYWDNVTYHVLGADPLVSKPAVDWSGSNQPIAGGIHGQRLFAWGVQNAPHRLYGSQMANHGNFEQTGTFTANNAVYYDINSGVGQRIYCAREYKGLLLILKYPVGVFWLDDSDINPIGWRTKTVTASIGCVNSPYALQQFDNGLLFMAPDGSFHVITATTQGGIDVIDITVKMNIYQWLLKNVNLQRLEQVVSSYNPTTKQILYALPAVGESENNLLLIFDMIDAGRYQGKVRFSYSYQDNCVSLATRRDPASFQYKIMSGNTGGQVVQHNRNARLNQSSGYASNFQLSHENLRKYYESAKVAAMMKIWEWCDIEYIPTGGGDIVVTPYVDGVAQTAQTATLDESGSQLDPPAAGAGAFTIYLGSGPTILSELGGETPQSLPLKVAKLRLTGTGRRLSLHFAMADGSNIGNDFSITGIYLGFKRAGQDKRA